MTLAQRRWDQSQSVWLRFNEISRVWRRSREFDEIENIEWWRIRGDTIGGHKGVLERVEYDVIKGVDEVWEARDEVQLDRAITMIMSEDKDLDSRCMATWIRYWRNNTMGWCEFIVKIVDNTMYIRNMEDMKNSPNKEVSPCVEQWSGCNYLNGATYDG